MNQQRIAIVFDDRARPDTTGVYCHRALGGMCKVEHILPHQLPTIAPHEFDLIFVIDDGGREFLERQRRPLAYWAIDTHLDFELHLERARVADICFAAQRDGAERLRAAGISAAHWLPLACDPAIHRQHEVAKRHDVGFIGNIAPGPRAELLALILQNFPNAFVGKAYFDAMAEIYSASRIIFNRSIGNDVNMRVFEAMACGSLLLTNDLKDNGQSDLFTDGEHLITYLEAHEMLDKLKYYVSHSDERERIASLGRERVLANHTYRHRMEVVLDTLNQHFGSRAYQIPVGFRLQNQSASESASDSSSTTMAPSVSHKPIASIIIPCWNQRSFTRECISSVVAHTKLSWEMIVIDNGSTDGTDVFLEGVQASSSFPVQIIKNKHNRGFPAACNQGLEIAAGDYLVLLNNDTVVPEGWLEQLIALAESSPLIGLTGPMSNYASPPQLVERVPYHSLDGFHQFAVTWRAQKRGQWFEAHKLSGFCVLMKRQALSTIGRLDERFGLGMFDDDDLARRAHQAGFKLAVAHDLIVHHFGSRTFIGSAIDTEALLLENRDKFAEKWNLRDSLGTLVPLRPWSPDAGKSDLPRIANRRVRVTLTMIVRNEEANLPKCLESARGVFDEIIIVDTGSSDRTVEIARFFGAFVFDFPWIDDFAAARNAALEKATGDYAFWLDADDVLEPEQRHRLISLFDTLSPDSSEAYVVRCACDPDLESGGGSTVVDHIRLFPVREDVRWTYRVHEQILPSLRHAGIPVRWSDVTIRHTGYNDNEVRGRKLARDEKILLQELEARPDDPFVLFNLGNIALERKIPATALTHLKASLSRSAPSDSITRKLFVLIARAHQMLGENSLALSVCEEGLRFAPDDAELLFRKALLHRCHGANDLAEVTWRKVLTLRRPEQFSSLDMGIYGHLTRRNLAILAAERGRFTEEQEHWNAVLAECPDDIEANSRLRFLATATAIPAVDTVNWLFPGSERAVLPVRGSGDFDPYVHIAEEWVRRLDARVVVELGVRLGVSTRAFLAGITATGGHVWGVDIADNHGINDPGFTFVHSDAKDVSDRWDTIDLLHIDTDPHTEEQTMRWLELYSNRCRAIALHDTHLPHFGVGAAVRRFVNENEWRIYEYWGNPSGWIVLVRRDIALSLIERTNR